MVILIHTHDCVHGGIADVVVFLCCIRHSHVCRVRSDATSQIQLFRRPTPQEIGKSWDLHDGEISLAHTNADTMSSWLGNGLPPSVIESLEGVLLS